MTDAAERPLDGIHANQELPGRSPGLTIPEGKLA
jgi:hypothetical protein